jgi:hypothetical protein
LPCRLVGTISTVNSVVLVVTGPSFLVVVLGGNHVATDGHEPLPGELSPL